MQKTMFWLSSLLFFCSNQAMNKKYLWVKTTDEKKYFVDDDTIASSMLLTILHEKHKGSHIDPLTIPLDSKTFKLYWCYNAIASKMLYNKLSPHDYYTMINAAEKLKALKLYIHLLTEILPQENEAAMSLNCFHGHITQKWISHLLIGSAIKEKYDSYTFSIKKPLTNKTEPLTVISNNGAYLLHNFCDQPKPAHIELHTTKTRTDEPLHPSIERQYTCFSPNNKYIIIIDLFRGIYLYHIPTKKKSFLYEPYNQESDIIISDNSKYILSKQLLPLNDYTILYKLWRINDDNMPEEIDLADNLSASKFALFHPKSEHIFHLREGNLYIYNIAMKTNTKLKPEATVARNQPKTFIFYDNLVISSDRKHIIGKMKSPRNTSLSDHFNYVVFHIKNISKINFTLLPPSYKDYLTPVCIPHKNLIVYCADNKSLLQILNQKQILVASHLRKNSCISALATDKNGDYLACGYSDGVVMLWNIPNLQNKIIGTKLVGLNIPVKDLVLTDNHLLFSHSKPPLFVPNNNTGHAALWNMQGDKIIDFGNSVFHGNISQNGSFAAIAQSDIQPRNRIKSLTLTCFDIDRPLPTPTLKQAYNLLKESKKIN